MQESPSTSPAPSSPMEPSSPRTQNVRRQTAVYPNVHSANKTPKPFSRSAAKRESVMALGSIEHLQHYFTKAGLSAKTKPRSQSGSLVPAIGPPSLAIHPPEEAELDEPMVIPPTPLAPPQNTTRPFPSGPKSYQVDPEMLKPDVIRDLDEVETAWGLNPSRLKGSPKQGFDVLSVLKITTKAIRSVRNYVVSLPDDHPSHSTHTDLMRSATPGRTPETLKSSLSSKPANDPLSYIRNSALQVLIVLRSIEEAARVPMSNDPDDMDDVLSVGSGASQSRSQTPATFPASPRLGSTTLEPSPRIQPLQIPGRNAPIQIWSDSEGEEDFEPNNPRELWDDRLILGGGFLYKSDIDPASLAQERAAVSKYLDVVDDVLFGGRTVGPSSDDQPQERGWMRVKKEIEARTRSRGRASLGAGPGTPPKVNRGRRVVSAGMLDAMRELEIVGDGAPQSPIVAIAEEDESGVEDHELPEWARRNAFVDDELGRLRLFLVSNLPQNLVSFVPEVQESASAFRESLLSALSTGQLLCVAYNAAVRRSKKPWGFINTTKVHDLFAEGAQGGEVGRDETKGKAGWTFRRTENLRLWAAAIKLRYLISLAPSAKVTGGNDSSPLRSPRSPSIPTFGPDPTISPPVLFEPKLIARKEEGWEDMLQRAVLQWMTAAMDEMRLA